jgi:hypothetical protein
MTTLAAATAPRAGDRKHTEWLPGERVAIRIASDMTDGNYTMPKVDAGPRSGPPLHAHQNEDDGIEAVAAAYGCRMIGAPLYA